VPTFYTPDEVRKDIEITNLSVKVTETPRWLRSDEKRQGKQASTTVIAICGSATLQDLGESVIVASKRCTVEIYLTYPVQLLPTIWPPIPEMPHVTA
jgi:hypothetical protein